MFAVVEMFSNTTQAALKKKSNCNVIASRNEVIRLSLHLTAVEPWTKIIPFCIKVILCPYYVILFWIHVMKHELCSKFYLYFYCIYNVLGAWK